MQMYLLIDKISFSVVCLSLCVARVGPSEQRDIHFDFIWDTRTEHY